MVNILKQKRKNAACRFKIAVRCLLCLLIFQSCFGGRAVIRSEARTGVTEKEVVGFVTAYYKAHTSKDIDTLTDYVTDADCREMEEYLLQYRVLIECGFQGYQNIDAIVYPLSDGVHWVAYVSYDMVMEGLGTALPGLTAELVGSGKDGKLWIETYTEATETDLEDLAKEIRELSLSDEVVDRSNEVNKRYNEMLAENPGIVEMLESTYMLVQEAKAEYYSESEPTKEASEEKSGGKEKQYVVKKGDCLWDIAEAQLGDGMCWSRIYEANKALIGDDPNLLYVGIELELEK